MNIAFWKAAGIRAIRTFLQVILGVWTAGQVITEIDWKVVLLSAFSAAVYSLLTSIMAGLPEVDNKIGIQTTFNTDGESMFEGAKDYEDTEDRTEE